MKGLFLSVLYMSVTATQTASLKDVYCRSESVVIAMAIAADTQPGTEPPQLSGTAFRVSRVLRGTLETGQSLYSIDSQAFQIGSHYLLFVRTPTASEKASHASRQATLRVLPSTRLVTNAGAPVIPVRAGEAQIPIEQIFVGADLVNPERRSRLHAARRPLLLPVTALPGAFGRYHCASVSEAPRAPAAPLPYYSDAQVVAGTVQLVGVSLASSDNPDVLQHLVSLCPVDFAYPIPALKARLQGTVILRGTLSAGGAIETLWVHRGINPLLDRAALNGLSAARFPLPFVPDGRERVVTATVTFRRQ